MQYDHIARLLRATRLASGVTQSELAERARVSQRLWAEVERGERPNVSLATALRMLRTAGIGVELTDSRRQAGFAGRAAARRATWTGRQTTLSDAHEPPVSPRGRGARIPAATAGPHPAFAISRAPPQAHRRRRRLPARAPW